MFPLTDPAPVRPHLAICIVVIAIAFVIGWWNAGLINENGAFEMATLVTLLLVTTMVIIRLPSLAFGAEWHLPMLTTLLAMRELDFDKRFVESSVLKLRLYTGDAPLGVKLIGGAVIVLILLCLFRLVRHSGPNLWQALGKREGWAVLIPLAGLAVVVAKGLDGLGRKLAPLGIALTDAQEAWAATSEEALEFLFAAALLSALFLWIRRHA